MLRKYSKNAIIDSLKRVVEFQKKNGRRPQTIRVGNDTLSLAQYLNSELMLDARLRIKIFRTSKGIYPNYVDILGYHLMKSDYKVLWNIQKKVDGNLSDGASDNIQTNDVYTYFCQTFGKSPKTIDECLTLVKDHGYAHYYNDVYTNKEAINRMKKYQGINCTDSCHVFYNIAKALGYEVKCLHVRCSGGDGHVRLKLRHSKHTSGAWILRDPAAVLSKNGKPLTYNWCTSGFTLLGTDPSWFIKDLKR